MTRFSTLAMAALLLAGCSTSDPKPPGFAAGGAMAQAPVSEGFALPPPAAPQAQQSANSDMAPAEQNVTGTSDNLPAFPTAPAAPAASNCRTVGAVTTCDAASNAGDTHYTN